MFVSKKKYELLEFTKNILQVKSKEQDLIIRQLLRCLYKIFYDNNLCQVKVSDEEILKLANIEFEKKLNKMKKWNFEDALDDENISNNQKIFLENNPQLYEKVKNDLEIIHNKLYNDYSAQKEEKVSEIAIDLLFKKLISNISVQSDYFKKICDEVEEFAL